MNMKAGALITMACLIVSGIGTPAGGVEPKTGRKSGTIVAVGDSLTAGYGVAADGRYPAQLEKKLRKAGYDYRVINAGISGETSSGTLGRIRRVLQQHKPQIVILETGVNDGLRGTDPKTTRRNIEEIIGILRENKVTVVLAGMRMFLFWGTAHAEAFTAIYPELAKKYDLILIPFFLEGVVGVPELNLRDGLHPNAAGYRIVTDNVYPYIVQVIQSMERGTSGKGG